jgi:2-C-methyl-D-erythritol 4-phosphate cytidylyltransferase
MLRMSDVHVLIVAGGRGLRLGAPMPKQYADLAGKPLLARTVLAFLDLPRLGRLQLVIGAGQDAACATALASLPEAIRPGDSSSALMAPVPGGAERQDSVRAGLDALKPHVAEGDIILVHDAARPFIPNAMVNRVVAALDGGAVGHGYVQGRDKRQAEQAAMVDALMQGDLAAHVRAALLEPLAAQVQAARDMRAAKAAATKVEFFTLVRGDD